MIEEKANEAANLNTTPDNHVSGRKLRKKPVDKLNSKLLRDGETANKAHNLKGQRGLLDEILMLRVMMRRVKALADEGRSLPELLSVLRVLGLASTRLVTLLMADRSLAEDQDLAAALSKALSQVTDELGIGK
jgi:hypothetical protein